MKYIVRSKGGRATVEVVGVSGPECVEKTAEIVRRLGGAESVEHTSEYYDEPEQLKVSG